MSIKISGTVCDFSVVISQTQVFLSEPQSIGVCGYMELQFYTRLTEYMLTKSRKRAGGEDFVQGRSQGLAGEATCTLQDLLEQGS